MYGTAIELLYVCAFRGTCYASSDPRATTYSNYACHSIARSTPHATKF